jgi:hypothetical protein
VASAYGCRASDGDGRSLLSAAVGKKTNQPLDDTHRIDFNYKVAVASAQFIRVELAAKRDRSAPATISLRSK